MRGIVFWPIALGTCVVAGTAVVVLPGPLAAALVVGVAATIAAFRAPYRALIFGWAMLLPIWSVGPIDPVAFDALRVLGAAAIVLRPRSDDRPVPSAPLLSWGAPLLAVATLLIVNGVTSPDPVGLTTGTTMAVSIVLAIAVLRSIDSIAPLLAGYTAGATLSATVLLLTAAGFTALTPLDDPGLSRFAGLAPSAPRVSIELATAVCIAWSALGARRWRKTALLALLVCAVALLMSGGRVGVAGLVVAVGVATLAGWVKAKHVVGAVLLVSGALYLSQRMGFELHTIDRLFRFDAAATLTDFTTGRLDVIPTALQAIATDPLGYGATRFDVEFGLLPHTPILVFALAGGLVAGIITLLLSLRLLVRILTPRREMGGAGRAAYLTLGVLFGSILIEPTGPFVGITVVTLLLLCAALTRTNTSRLGANYRPRARVPAAGHMSSTPDRDPS